MKKLSICLKNIPARKVKSARNTSWLTLRKHWSNTRELGPEKLLISGRVGLACPNKTAFLDEITILPGTHRLFSAPDDLN